MLKRSVLYISALVMALAGCATVSVVPDSVIVESEADKEMSHLVTASTAFGEMATARGWISEQRGVFDLARVLIDGQSEAATDRSKSYADFIGANIRDMQDVSVTIATDAQDAADALFRISQEADTFLNATEGKPVPRADLVAFERALVQAQQARRAFTEAMTIAELTQDADVNMGLTKLDLAIDRTRLLADQLANQYSSRTIAKAATS